MGAEGLISLKKFLVLGPSGTHLLSKHFFISAPDNPVKFVESVAMHNPPAFKKTLDTALSTFLGERRDWMGRWPPEGWTSLSS